MVIRHTSLFDPLTDDELHELKVRAADWRVETEHAFLITGNLHERAMMYELQTLHRQLRTEQKYRAARRRIAA